MEIHWSKILATPKKDIIQSIGRILRKPIKEGDINPLVVEITDNLSCIKMWGNKREAYYEKKNYNFCRYRAFNDKIISIKDYMIAKDMIKKTDKIDGLEELRKKYIIHESGESNYEFEKDIEFASYPDEMFTYSTNYDDIFDIKHVYDKEENQEKKVIINCNPKKITVRI